ncbi:MAG TPA: CorA family divalent cation transporter [Methyloceanibacter sp.]|nr:CorA family divalent cation transporter [Methyloceanibacter sp.]
MSTARWSAAYGARPYGCIGNWSRSARSSSASSTRSRSRRIRPSICARRKLLQRLDWIDTEIVELRDRSRLLQEEIMLKSSEQTNRSLHVLAIVTTVFLPATLVTGVFGMNVAGLPLTQNADGFLWAMVLTAGAAAFVYWLLKRAGTVGR